MDTAIRRFHMSEIGELALLWPLNPSDGSDTSLEMGERDTCDDGS